MTKMDSSFPMGVSRWQGMTRNSYKGIKPSPVLMQVSSYLSQTSVFKFKSPVEHFILGLTCFARAIDFHGSRSTGSLPSLTGATSTAQPTIQMQSWGRWGQWRRGAKLSDSVARRWEAMLPICPVDLNVDSTSQPADPKARTTSSPGMWELLNTPPSPLFIRSSSMNTIGL